MQSFFDDESTDLPNKPSETARNPKTAILPSVTMGNTVQLLSKSNGDTNVVMIHAECWDKQSQVFRHGISWKIRASGESINEKE